MFQTSNKNFEAPNENWPSYIVGMQELIQDVTQILTFGQSQVAFEATSRRKLFGPDYDDWYQDFLESMGEGADSGSGSTEGSSSDDEESGVLFSAPELPFWRHLASDATTLWPTFLSFQSPRSSKREPKIRT